MSDYARVVLLKQWSCLYPGETAALPTVQAERLAAVGVVRILVPAAREMAVATADQCSVVEKGVQPVPVAPPVAEPHPMDHRSKRHRR